MNIVVALLVATVGCILYFYNKYYLSFWKNRGIPFIRTFQTFFSVLINTKCPAIAMDEIYNDPNTKNEPVVGINLFHRPSIMIKDPELIKKVLIKDFNNFQDRFASADQHKDLLGSNNLFFKKTPQWKYIRTNLTPVFTSGKIKQMFHLANDIGKELDKYISKQSDNQTESFVKEARGVAQLFTIDVIASIAYGINANSISNPKADFLQHGKEMFHFTRWRAFEFFAFFFLPDVISFLDIKFFTKNSTAFLSSTFKDIMDERKKSGLIRNDLIQTLLTLQKQSETDPEKKLDEITLTAQAATFFSAGFETTSTTMSFAIYELARHQDIQKRLRQEIKDVLEANNGDITYDKIQEMEYLSMIIQETLRLYPILPFLDRVYVNDKGEDYDLEPFCEASIPSGTPIFVPLYSIQRDEKYFENPTVFNPERFAPENKDKIQPYTSFPFGLGPRNCIGERLGLLQSKIGIFYFLKNHKIELTKDTIKEPKLEKKALLLQLEGGIHCKFTRDPLYGYL